MIEWDARERQTSNIHTLFSYYIRRVQRHGYGHWARERFRHHRRTIAKYSIECLLAQNARSAKCEYSINIEFQSSDVQFCSASKTITIWCGWKEKLGAFESPLPGEIKQASRMTQLSFMSSHSFFFFALFLSFFWFVCSEWWEGNLSNGFTWTFAFCAHFRNGGHRNKALRKTSNFFLCCVFCDEQMSFTPR